MRIRFIIFFLIGVTSFFSSCTKPPAVQYNYDSPDVHFYSRDNLPKRIHGFGEITLSIEGRRYIGSFDIDWKSDFFQLSVYSPFGGLAAVIHCDSLRGKISTDGKDYIFFLDDEPDSLPFMLGEGLTFRDFIFIMTGRLPQNYDKLRQKPDTVLDGKRDQRLIWNSDPFEIVAYISKKSTSISRLEIRNIKNKAWHLFFNGINQSFTRSIELKVDDRNYFSVRYERLKQE